MATIYEKIAAAKREIANTKMEKGGYNEYSKYYYFTQEQVAKLVYDACENQKLLTMFSLKRDANGVFGELTVLDLETNEKETFIAATAIPEIKATNVAQQLGGAMTYTERYLKMTVFWIYDNNLDFDTTENTKKVANTKPAFGEKQLDGLTAKAKKWEYKTAADAIADAKKYYSLTADDENKIKELFNSLSSIQS